MLKTRTTINTLRRASRDIGIVSTDTDLHLMNKVPIIHHLKRTVEEDLVMRTKHLLEARTMLIHSIQMAHLLQPLLQLLTSLKYLNQIKGLC